MMRKQLRPLLVALLLLPACVEEGPPEASSDEGLVMRALALTGGSCAEPKIDAFADISSVKFTISGFDPESGEFESLIEESRPLSGSSFKVKGVPEGSGHQLTLLATGAQSSWYGCEDDVTVIRDEDNLVDVLLGRHGGFSCLQDRVPNAVANVVFPAAVELGDGRVLITGGFTHVNVINNGTKTVLTGGSSAAYLFDPDTGATTELIGGMGNDKGRGAHAMAFIPSPTGSDAGKVLIIGGANELVLATGDAFPFQLDKENARADYVLFDVTTETFTAGEDTMRFKRAFPRIHRLNDGTVVITGGGEWPYDATDVSQEAEVFDPYAEDGGEIVPTFLLTNLFSTFFGRAGHSLTFIKNSQDGLSQLLVWGGTVPDLEGTFAAEILKQSAQQKEGIDGSFAEVDVQPLDGSDVPFTYFHEMTPLGGSRFLLTGGTRVECTTSDKPDTCTMKAPADDEAWLITYSDDAGPTATVQKVPGLGAGRVFHSTHPISDVAVATVGGFDSMNAIGVDKVMHFDSDSLTWTPAPETGSAFVGRGGHVGVTLCSSVLLFGGENVLNKEQVDGEELGYLELYVPSNAPLP